MKIKFSIDKQIDKEVAEHFFDLKRGGVDFNSKIKKVLPELKNKEEISKQVDRYYQENLTEIEESRDKIRTLWDKNNKEAASYLNNFFNFKPDFNLTCYLSIFNIGPKDLVKKDFQVWYQSKHPLLSILHELGHFYFYQKIILKQKTKSLAALEEDDELWYISEIFNNFLLAQPELKSIHGEIPYGYPEHHEITLTIAKDQKVFKNFEELYSKIIKINSGLGKK